jgi:protein O-GlcNAc transferase
MFGVDSGRMVLTPQAPWIDHLITKTSIDMILDTPSKNGHTTGLDGLWAGVPTVSLGGGRMMEQR